MNFLKAREKFKNHVGILRVLVDQYSYQEQLMRYKVWNLNELIAYIKGHKTLTRERDLEPTYLDFLDEIDLDELKDND